MKRKAGSTTYTGAYKVPVRRVARKATSRDIDTPIPKQQRGVLERLLVPLQIETAQTDIDTPIAVSVPQRRRQSRAPARSPRAPTALQTLKAKLRADKKTLKKKLQEVNRDLRSLGVGKKKRSVRLSIVSGR